MITVNDENQLMKILNVIAEEAIQVSKQQLFEMEDPFVEKYNKQYEDDENEYGSLSEQEEAEQEEDKQEEEPDKKPEEDAEAKDNQEEQQVDPSPAEAFGVSFESVIDAINNLRAGKSLKNDTIKGSASAYYDRLTEPERKVLLVFLKELSKILAGSLEGSKAADPSDPPFNIVIKASDNEAQPEPEQAQQDEPADEASPDQAEETDDDEGEDTSPPIKVNESQETYLLRKKIRELMSRG